MDYGTTPQWIPTAVGPWPHFRLSARGRRVSTHLYALSSVRSYYNYFGVLSIVLLRRIGSNPEEQERLRILGTLDAQNIRVSRHWFVVTY